MLLFWLFCCIGSTFAFDLRYKRENVGGEDVGERLILTPYIEAGEIEKAKQLARVKPLVGEVESYSGYVTVDKKCDSNMFFWFFPTESNDENAPVAVWLQGGPGSSSMFGLLSEIGPFDLNTKYELKLRKYSWTKVASYVFIDNPVGTGYSYTNSTDCYSRNEVDVGKNLLSAVKQIMKLFPEYKNNPFFVTGESYAGKYVPALSYAIHKDADKDFKINLQGLAIGNGIVDPVNQLLYADYLYQLGFVDATERDLIKIQEHKCKEEIINQKWNGSSCSNILTHGGKPQEPFHLQNLTGIKSYYNYLSNERPQLDYISSYMTSVDVRKAIHVGNATWFNATLVQIYLGGDELQSVRPWLEELLEHYRVLIYTGQLDLVLAYPLILGYLQKLQWSAADEYKTAERHVWKVNDDVAGYAKTAGNLTEVLVRNAGHMVPSDQPEWAYDLIFRFFYNIPFSRNF